MQSYISLLVDQYQAGRTLQLIGLHGLGYGAVVGRCVDGYRKTQAVLVHEGFKRYRPHCGVMLEHRMQAYYSYLVGRKRGMYGLCLRYRSEARRVGKGCVRKGRYRWGPDK